MALLNKLFSQTLAKSDYDLDARTILQESYSCWDLDLLAVRCLPFGVILDVKNRHGAIQG